LVIILVSQIYEGNPSDGSMSVELTEPLTSVSTRDICWKVNASFV